MAAAEGVAMLTGDTGKVVALILLNPAEIAVEPQVILYWLGLLAAPVYERPALPPAQTAETLPNDTVGAIVMARLPADELQQPFTFSARI